MKMFRLRIQLQMDRLLLVFVERRIIKLRSRGTDVSNLLRDRYDIAAEIRDIEKKLETA